MIQTSDDEFGYDFETDDEELLIQLASNHSPPPKQSTNTLALGPAPSTDKKTIASLEAVRETKTFQEHIYRTDAPPFGFVKKTDTSTADQKEALSSPSPVDKHVAYPDLTSALQAIESVQSPPPTEVSDDDEVEFEDDRSPLQRFRAYPKRPLTVTDLTAGAWCELQYWYTLTRLPGGRKTRTPAMQQGSKVHKKLEDEVHTTVKIEIVRKEDGFGLRLWNLVQGLRTLRDTGLTRELEVWGIVDGNLVNGVIDDLSYDNPNPEFEEELSAQGSQPSQSQSMISDYFPLPKSEKPSVYERKVFLTDVKTRGTLSPISAAVIRPAKIQLLLYHRFLSDMAADKLDFFKVFRRYGLDADERFSDTFMSQIGELHDEIFFDTPTSSAEEYMELLKNAAKGNAAQGDSSTAVLEPDSSPGAPDLLKYGSLRELLTLVKDEIRLTFPRGADSLGHMLRVQYVYREDGRELTTHDFPVSPQTLDTYLAGDMSWWRGERKPAGVTIEEAFKCLSCEFAASCKWRRQMDEERVKRTQNRVNKAKKAVETRF
ncbi:exonuclease v [Trichoderma arundinaceum]|uniref:Exonuclease v n=1 Tax=Trichoderma arundinaceum TaxID=490622 RepID=A0A395NRN3_TRIAR|nr:exonuclease v [Trichoderma arundinaceum]